MNRAANNQGLFVEDDYKYLKPRRVCEKELKIITRDKSDVDIVVLVMDESGHPHRGDHQNECHYTLKVKGRVWLYVPKKLLSLQKTSREIAATAKKRALARISHSCVRR